MVNVVPREVPRTKPKGPAAPRVLALGPPPFSVQCVTCLVYGVHCIVCSVQCVVCSVQCIVFSVQYAAIPGAQLCLQSVQWWEDRKWRGLGLEVVSRDLMD